LVIWHRRPGVLGEIHASWTFHCTRAVAAALAPRDGTPYTVVDVARKPWKQHPMPKGRPMTPQEFLRAQAAAIEAATDLRPTPGGAAGRAAAEHHAAAGLKSRLDADQYADRILGHEAAAKALTDAALCELEQNAPGAQ
jgi:hypothetical protein